MPVGLLGRKVGMTQVYEEGTSVAVTVIEAGPCVVLQVKTPEKDGYTAVQLGYGEKPRRLASRAERGRLSDLGGKRSKARQESGIAELPRPQCEPVRYIREFRLAVGEAAPEVGAKLSVESMANAQRIDVVGNNKGRGFAGVMKQHNFHGLRASHGVQRHHRAGGSIAAHATNRGWSGRIKKGKRMSGRWGNERSTVRYLRIVRVDIENNLILVAGSVPGPNGAFVTLKHTTKKIRPVAEKTTTKKKK
ncbi:MAG TPA: 50S ribosomal protein L3 [Planctomycetaceae bacterium]|jgi:large subunit ribosomal protein L3|nr:50S ribosomal protein L3 [Planctomycetaceae bacterium]